MKNILITITLLTSCFFIQAQTADQAFKKPLKEVISTIESRFKVKIRYPEALVADKQVTYAEWRFRPDLETTLHHIMDSQDITFTKEGEGKYKLQAFQYHLKTPEEGKQQLNYLSTLSPNITSWELRKTNLKNCIWQALEIAKAPAKPQSQAIITSKRIMDGYTVENVAIETLPGVYVSGSLYRPLKSKGRIPVILNPDGHFGDGRYRADCQYRCAALAKMGAMAFSYDLFAWGESTLQFKSEDHRRSHAQTIQMLNGMRILDWLLNLKDADPTRVGITGASGGGSQTMLLTAIDDRIKVSVPVAMMSSYHSGGCPCESGMGVHLCGEGTNNVEIASMAAPRAQMIISDGKDWTQFVPQTEFPFVQRIYDLYHASNKVQNAHFPSEGHDYGANKRKAMYGFMAKELGLDLQKIQDVTGNIVETGITIEPFPALYVFGEKGEKLPSNAIKDFEIIEKMFTK